MIELLTKYDETIEEVSDLDLMKNKFLAERLVRSWNEDFIDEDTGESISIQRNEILFEKGTLLNQDVLSQINFYLQSGDIKSIKTSTQKRTCTLVQNYSTLYIVSVQVNRKKKTLYLYANSLDVAKNIVTDYIEQTYTGQFSFVSVKSTNQNTVLISPDNENHDEDSNYYILQIEIYNEDEDMRVLQDFVVKSIDAESAKEVVLKYLVASERDFNELTIISAKTISCSDVIDIEFSRKHIENAIIN